MRRKGSTRHQFVQRIPADVKARAVGKKLLVPVGDEVVPITITAKTDAVRVSLRTASPAEVKQRQAQAAGYLAGIWEALRSSAPVVLGQREATALAGVFYRNWAEGRRELFDSVQELPDGGLLVSDEAPDDITLDAEAARGDPLSWDGPERTAALKGYGPVVDKLLLSHGIAAITETSRALVLEAFHKAMADAVEHGKRKAGGDYSPDPKANRFPVWENPIGTSEPRRNGNGQVRLLQLVEDWWVEAKAAGNAVSTYESYRGTFTRLAKFLNHNNAAAVTTRDIVAFKDFRLAEGIGLATVGESDLSALRSVFGWAVVNQRLDSNPAENVRVKRVRRTRTRPKDFTEDEARAILRHSLGHQRGRESRHVSDAKRWVPWLCAYTGARLGEVVQLRKEDVRRAADDCWIITITPEAGTVKDKEAREVVLHEHLLEQGLGSFVDNCESRYLFLRPNRDGEVRGAWRSVKNRVREFAREVVSDNQVAPNHGWRHLFKTRGREAGIADTVLDAICGHAGRTEGSRYGTVTLKTQREAMARFPRFVLEDAGCGKLT